MPVMSLVGTSRSSTPPVMSSAAPRAMANVPSVTMNAGIFALAIKKPLMNPHAMPASRPTTSPATIVPVPLPPTAFIALAAATPANTSTEPTERSIPAVMMT